MVHGASSGERQRSRALAFAALGVVALVADGAVVAHGIRRVAEADGWVVHTQDVLLASQELVSAIQDAYAGQPGIVATGGADALQRHDQAFRAARERLERLRQLTQDNPEQQRRLERMRPLVERELGALRAATVLVPGGAGPERARAKVVQGAGGLHGGELRAEIAAMVATELRLRDERARASHVVARGAIAADVLGVVASVVLVSLAYRAVGSRQRERELAAARLMAESERLRTTLSSIGDAVIVTDGEGKITMLNPAAGALTAWGDQALGRPLGEVLRLVDERTRQEVPSPVRKVLRAGAVVGLANHTLLVTRDGREVPIDDSGAPIRDRDGRIVGVVLVFRDIAERRRAEETQARLAAIVEDSEDAIISKDLDGRILTWNAAAERLLGYGAAEMVGRSIERIIPPERRGEEEDIVARIRAGERVYRLETQRVTRSGVVLDVSITVSPVRDRDGRIRGASKIIRDVTRQKQAEQALRDSDRRKTEFLAVLSHELRNPLAPLRNAVHVLGRVPPGGEQAARAREIVARQTEHLARLVDDLLDVTRISRGKIELRRARVDLREVVRRTCDDHRALFQSEGLELCVDAPEPVWADADPARVAQVVGNLLQNAARFGRDGGRVAVAVGAPEGRAEIRVSDDGVGIAPELLPHVFEPFVQAHAGLARTKGGLGLGLALVKELVELHGGTVAARSEGEGRGAELVVRLPLARAPEQRPASAAPPAVRARQVLVIEDNADAARTLAELLELEGHRVHVASDGRSGMAKARSLRPEVILCDIGLPDVDGYEVARALRSDAALRATRLIALSGYAQPEDRRRAREAGFDVHVPKPPQIDVLLAAVAAEQAGSEPG